LLKFINAYKSASSRLVKKEFPEIKDKLWKQSFWKIGYFITTTGGANIDTIKQYIEGQKRK
jgi:putative transposase